MIDASTKPAENSGDNSGDDEFPSAHVVWILGNDRSRLWKSSEKPVAIAATLGEHGVSLRAWTPQ